VEGGGFGSRVDTKSPASRRQAREVAQAEAAKSLPRKKPAAKRNKVA
jgi:hypothetical protein